MIAIRKSRDFGIGEVVARSEVAHIPDAEAILRRYIYRSIEVRVGLVDEEIACVWGLIPPTLLSHRAWLWLLTTDIAAQHKFLLIRYSQRYIEQALKEFPEIVGDCLVANKPAQRWLKWLGAEFGEAEGGRIPFLIKAKTDG